MKHQRTRLLAASGATLALVMAASAAVAAHGPRDDERGLGIGRMGIGVERLEMGKGMPGARGGLPWGLGDVERHETTIQTADSVSSYRVEQGVVSSADETALSFSLGSGEAVTVGIDEDTAIVGYEEQTVTRGAWSRMRLAPTDLAAGDIAAGAEVVVWSDAEDGADYVASQVVVVPADETTDADADAAEETEDAATDPAASTTEGEVAADA